MRDPTGFVEVTEDAVSRHAYVPLPEPHFLDSGVARALVAQGSLTPFEFESRSLLHARKLPFVSYPWEWTHGQFLAAASATLDVAEEALQQGHELKDASAFNVIFAGAQAEFCDHFSFQPIRRREWWAYGQFARHFLFPLAVARHAGQEAADVFKANLDGLTLQQARAQLGWRRFGHRIGLAFLQGTDHATRPFSEANAPFHAGTPSLHKGVFQFLRWQLAGLDRPAQASVWVAYETTRAHYTPSAITHKRHTVARWLQQTSPSWVADLGCNQGEFSLLAAELADGVIAVDADASSVEGLRRGLQGHSKIYTACAVLDDLSAGRGWLGGEYSGLAERIHSRVTLVMALALIHHLAIGRGIPLPEVATLMARCTKRFLIVEMLESQDPMVVELLANRDRDDADAFSLDAQRAAFAHHFRLIEEVQVEGSGRWLALMEKHEPN